tara:strand:- start:23 stop:385 length:363 start_codon:yes stop_codon:yes gene_type:complete
MNKEFIPYEEALALKELGFDEKCFASWWNDQLVTDYIDQEEIDALSRPSAMSKNYSYMLAPLYQQAFRWFREKYNWINPTRQLVFILDKTAQSDNPMSYEEAELACLRKLIELLKPKEDE